MDNQHDEVNLRTSAITLLAQIYIILCCFPQLVELPITGYKVQPSELLFFPLFLLIIFQKEFWIDTFQLFTSNRKHVRYLYLSVLFYLAASIFSAVFNFSLSVFLELAGTGYLVSVFFILSYVFSKERYGSIEKWKGKLIFATVMAAIIGIIGVILHFSGIENSTGKMWDYPYLGHVFRLQGFTPSPAFFINIISIGILLLLGEEHGELTIFSKKTSLFLLLIVVIPTFAKTILNLFIFGGLYLTRKYVAVKSKGRIIFNVSISGLFVILMIGTHLLFVSCLEFGETVGRNNDRFAVGAPLYQKGDFCIYQTPYLKLKFTAIRAGNSNFLYGEGAGNHGTMVPNYEKSGELHFQKSDPHCTYTGAYGELGIFGLLSVLFLFFSLLKNANSVGLSFFCIALYFLSEGITTDILNFRHLWVFIALTGIIAAQKQPL